MRSPTVTLRPRARGARVAVPPPRRWRPYCQGWRPGFMPYCAFRRVSLTARLPSHTGVNATSTVRTWSRSPRTRDASIPSPSPSTCPAFPSASTRPPRSATRYRPLLSSSVDGHERRLVLRHGDRVDERQGRRVVAGHRLLAPLVLGLLVRRVHVASGDVDVADVVVATPGPFGRDRVRDAVRVLEAIVDPCQHACAREHPAPLGAGDPLVVDGLELRFARETGVRRGVSRTNEERNDGDDRRTGRCPSTTTHPAAL